MPNLDGTTIDELLAAERNVELRVRVICYGNYHADTEFVVVTTSPDGVKESIFKHGIPGFGQACEAYDRELGL